MKKNKLFLNFDNDREHRPICIECKKILEPLLVAECFTNPFERLNEKKPKTLIKELDLKGLEKWF